jgi:hypothetical protein
VPAAEQRRGQSRDAAADDYDVELAVEFALRRSGCRRLASDGSHRILPTFWKKTPLSKRRDLSTFTILSNPENAKQNGYLAVGSAGRMR